MLQDNLSGLDILATQFNCQLNCVGGISRPDIDFSVCEASTIFKQATVADVLCVNK